MDPPSRTRRNLLRYYLASSATAVRATRTTMAASTLFLAVERTLIAQETPMELTVLTPSEAEEFAAIAERIIPSDDTPGATEAGAIFFIDRVLSSSRTELLPGLREGLSLLQATGQAAHGNPRFSTLAAAQQDELLRQIEDSTFFTTMRYLTICGTFASPEYGGNRDYVGWSLIGFDHGHAWQAPYGYYDADYLKKGE